MFGRGSSGSGSRQVSVMPGEPSSSESTPVKAFREGEVDAYNMDSDADFWDSYDDVRTLGKGTFAKVKEVEHLQTRERFAAKIMDKDPINNDMDDMVREVQILSMLRHRNVLCLYAAYETPRKLYLITELANGGELMQKNGATYPEAIAMRHTRTICEAIAYMHGAHVTHRDLKPENVLLGGPQRSTIKIVDMGLSRPFDRQLMTTICGTHKYLAPELVECDRGTLRGYDQTVDVWGVGLLAYIMLFGTNPFARDSTSQTHEAILRCDHDFPSSASELAKGFIRKTVCRKTKDRPSAANALSHEWLVGAGGGGGGSGDSYDISSRPASAASTADGGKPKGGILGGMFRSRRPSNVK